jgi:hypothetical protein
MTFSLYILEAPAALAGDADSAATVMTALSKAACMRRPRAIAVMDGLCWM